MATTSAKAIALSHDLADVLSKRLSLAVTEGFDTAGPHPTIQIGAGTVSTESMFIRTMPIDWPLALNVVGNASQIYTPHVIQLVTEAPATTAKTHPVDLATAAALPACTAGAGPGVGKTLTGNINAALTVDGVAVLLNQRVLVKDQVTGADNGVYVQTTLGSGGAAFILTRATDFDAATAAEVSLGASVPVRLGTANAGKTFTLTTATAITVDTTALAFTVVTATLSVDDLLKILGDVTQRGCNVEWYQTAQGTNPTVDGITATNLVSKYTGNLYWSTLSAS